MSQIDQPLTDTERAELEYLRARVQTLEEERLEQARLANEAIVNVQNRLYWLDRFQIDLNSVMASSWVMAIRGLAKRYREPIRAARAFARGIEHRCRFGVMVQPVRAPVVHQHRQIEIVRRDARAVGVVC